MSVSSTGVYVLAFRARLWSRIVPVPSPLRFQYAWFVKLTTVDSVFDSFVASCMIWISLSLVNA